MTASAAPAPVPAITDLLALLTADPPDTLAIGRAALLARGTLRRVGAQGVSEIMEVLAKYADRSNYDGSPSAIDMDDGEAARAVLARLREGK